MTALSSRVARLERRVPPPPAAPPADEGRAAARILAIYHGEPLPDTEPATVLELRTVEILRRMAEAPQVDDGEVTP